MINLRYIRKAIIILLLAAGHRASAQFNDSVHFYINYATTGIINNTTDGNSYVLNNALKFNVNRKKLTINTTNTWIYGAQEHNLTNNDFMSVMDFNIYDSARRVYYWGLLTYTSSYSLKINNQFQGGLGLGYFIFNKKNTTLSLSDGILYENNDLFDPKIGWDKYQTLRNSFRIKYRLAIRNLLVIDGSDFLQNSLSSWDDYIIKLNTNLSIKLKKWLSLTTSFSYNRINRTQRENLLLNFGLSVEKYF